MRETAVAEDLWEGVDFSVAILWYDVPGLQGMHVTSLSPSQHGSHTAVLLIHWGRS